MARNTYWPRSEVRRPAAIAELAKDAAARRPPAPSGGDSEAPAAPPHGPVAAGSAGRVFAFRADSELVQVLSAMPNASDFIRKAIARSLEEPCPVCLGRGVVAPGFRGEFERLSGHLVLRRCDCCSAEYPALCEAGAADAHIGAARLRWELQVRRGQYICVTCFDRSAPCDICGLRYPEHRAADIVRHFEPLACGRALVTGSLASRDAPRAGTAGGAATRRRGAPATRPARKNR